MLGPLLMEDGVMAISRTLRVGLSILAALSSCILSLANAPVGLATDGIEPSSDVPSTRAPAVTLSSSAVTAMRATWRSYGVSTKTQNALIANLKAGKGWDSFTSAKATRTKTTNGDGFLTRVLTFKDGSIRVLRLQNPSTPISINTNRIHLETVASCVVSETHYSFSAKGCIASSNFVLGGMMMTVDYHGDISLTNAQIDQAYDGQAWLIALGTADAGTPTKISSTEYHMTVAFNTFGGLGTSPQVLIVKSSGRTTLDVSTRV